MHFVDALGPLRSGDELVDRLAFTMHEATLEELVKGLTSLGGPALEDLGLYRGGRRR
ncbi:hypothetical protein AB0C18_25730 [Nonomuraea muscovyensis]|uniref:hypothetical protein n=1 Tax=Nonomuraea muscovyensis TaxID=1124761 RepID=UPI003403B5AF